MADSHDKVEFLDLPDEVLVLCLSSLDMISVKNVSLVCKRLNRLSKDDDVWKSVYFLKWPCSDDVASHPVVQQVLHCNSWHESALYRQRLYGHLAKMISYPRFRQELDYGKYSAFARHVGVESLVACILCIGVFGVPGVGDGFTWVEHQRIALHFFMRKYNLHTTVSLVLQEMFVNTTAFDDEGGPGVFDFMRYTDWAKDFHSSDIFGVLWNVGMLQNHGMTVPNQYNMQVMNDRARRALYGLIDCSAKRPASYVCGGLPYAFSNHPIARGGPFIIDPEDPRSRLKPIEGQYYTKWPWVIAYHKGLDLYPAHYNTYSDEDEDD